MKSLYGETQGKEKRRITLPPHLLDSVVDDHIPSDVQKVPGSTDLRQTVVGVCDVIGEELSRRFGKDSTSIWIAMQALSPQSETFC